MAAATEKCCHICKRLLDQPSDPLSADCGGDCWGCVGRIEAEGGHPESLLNVRNEIALGLREPLHDLPEDDDA